MFNENYEGKKPLDFYLSEKRTEELIKILRDYIYLYYLIQYSRNLKIRKDNIYNWILVMSSRNANI